VGSTPEKVRSIGAVIVSILTAAIAIWWLALVAARLGLKPEVNAQGVVVLDQFQRAKDILLVVLPLFSAALAYFVGSQGTADAKKEAAEQKTNLKLSSIPHSRESSKQRDRSIRRLLRSSRWSAREEWWKAGSL
jgi:hypothetical protein